jgi:hypothetical protein
MRYEIIGLGRLGSAIAYTLMLMGKDNDLHLLEYHQPSRKRAIAEYYDLLPVAIRTGNRLHSTDIGQGGVYIITAGVPRRTLKQSKKGLFTTNKAILASILPRLDKDKLVFIATNPPEELANWARSQGYYAVPLRKCTDDLRLNYGGKKINDIVLRDKGYTQYTPAYACVCEILATTSSFRKV